MARFVSDFSLFDLCPSGMSRLPRFPATSTSRSKTAARCDTCLAARRILGGMGPLPAASYTVGPHFVGWSAKHSRVPQEVENAIIRADGGYSINLPSMVDIIFHLLIFFMVAASPRSNWSDNCNRQGSEGQRSVVIKANKRLACHKVIEVRGLCQVEGITDIAGGSEGVPR
jgi:hypothetical protein